MVSSFTDVSDMDEHDPLADATYIRANFTYIPRTPRELSIRTGDVFHIHEEVCIVTMLLVSVVIWW